MKITETGNYKELAPLFIASGLEVSHEDDCPTEMITCWKAHEEGSEAVCGGISIEKRKGFYIIGEIAVKPELRHSGIATQMMKTAMERIREMGEDTIYLVAKAPEFFETLGFYYLTPEETPEIFNCQKCEQRGVKCFPEFMRYDFK